jgi:hypothetical protein
MSRVKDRIVCMEEGIKKLKLPKPPKLRARCVLGWAGVAAVCSIFTAAIIASVVEFSKSSEMASFLSSSFF